MEIQSNLSTIATHGRAKKGAVVGRCTLWRFTIYSKTALCGCWKLVVIGRYLLLRDDPQYTYSPSQFISGTPLILSILHWLWRLGSTCPTAQAYDIFLSSTTSDMQFIRIHANMGSASDCKDVTIFTTSVITTILKFRFTRPSVLVHFESFFIC